MLLLEQASWVFLYPGFFCTRRFVLPLYKVGAFLIGIRGDKLDRLYMRRAIELARKGAGQVAPNPLVGAVIVKEGRVIGEGWHAVFGGPHAEVHAISNASESVAGSTIYVTLEPCSHHGKTPPCAEALVSHGFKRVVVAMEDPNPLVAGRGIDLLKSSGIEVTLGVLEEEAKQLNAPFIKNMRTQMPFCVMKTGMTLDGKIATSTGNSRWITCEASRKMVHGLRHRYSGIMVGIGTVLADDPELTTRLEGVAGIDPHRIVVDTRARIPLEARLLSLKSPAKTIVATTRLANPDKIKALEAVGAEIICTPLKEGQVDLTFLMLELAKRGIDSVLLEGGGTLNYNALKAGIVDQVLAFIAPKLLGGIHAKTPVEGQGVDTVDAGFMLENIKVTQVGTDILISGDVKKEAPCSQD